MFRGGPLMTVVVVLAGGVLQVIRAQADMPVPAQMGGQLTQHARELVDQGRFREAEEVLRRVVRHKDTPVDDAAEIELEIIRRIRMDYSLTSEQLLEKVRANIPDATPDDVQRWTKEGVLEHRVIDGELRYFNREASNLLRFSDEARRRFIAAKQAKGEKAVIPGEWKFGLVPHLATLLQISERADQSEIFPVKHRVRYTLKVNDGHPRVQAGAVVRCWLPLPHEYRQQKDVRIVSTSPGNPVVASNEAAQRTVYFEQKIEDPSKPVRFAAEFEFTTSAYVPKLDPAKAAAYDTASTFYREYTSERRPHIAFTPKVREIVDQVTKGETNPLLKAKTLYLWCCANLRYCSELEYSTIRSISDKALTTRKGDCGVQALAFITLCRAAGVPARWQSGWETLPEDWNMHDWAEFYVEPWGWLPADPSYGLMKTDDPAVREFYFGHLDAYRMIVNLDYGRELVPPKTSFRSEPADFQRGEIEIDGHNLYFDEWDYTFEVETIPPGDVPPAPAKSNS